MWQDKVIVVTGGAVGIGKALSGAAAVRGASVALLDIDEERAEAAATEIVRNGGTAQAFICDITDRERLTAVAAQMERMLGAPNLVFANAGVLVGGTLPDTAPADMEWMLAVNIAGTFNTVQAFLPGLRRAAAEGPARIVVTGSDNSLSVAENAPYSIYTATQHATLGLAEALRRDLAGSGIAVSLLCPGATRTELFDAKRTRQTRFGGEFAMGEEEANRVRTMMEAAGSQDPELTASLCFAGIENDDFYIVTDPNVGRLVDRRHAEVTAALEKLHERLAPMSH